MILAKVIEPKKKTLKTDDIEPLNVAAYCRVSTDSEDQKNSLVAQTEFFDDYFSFNPNWTKVGIYADEGLSGTSLEKRDQFNRMIADARSGKIDIIITKEVSRFSRNVQHTLNIVEELRNKGVYIYFLTEEINTQSDDYREKLIQCASNAEQESLKTSRRVRLGHHIRMRAGVVFGRREMFGYRITRDEDKKQHFEIVPEEAEVVKKIFEWFASGEGTHRIGRKLEQQGILTQRYKNSWQPITILRILRNEKYVGDLIQGKTYTPDPLTHKKKYNNGESFQYVLEDHHTPIIDRELWNKVQAILKEKAPTDEVKAKHCNRYWTSGKVYCGLCGQRYVSYVKKQKNGTYRAWVCFENHQRGKYKQITLDTGEKRNVGCNALRVNDRVLKTAVHDIITEYIIPNKQTLIKALKEEIKELSKPTDNTAKINRTKKALEKKKEQITTLTIGWTSGKVLDIAYYSSVERLNKEYEELKEQLRKMQEQDNSVSTEVQIYEEYITKLESVLALSENDLNEAFYERATKQIFVYPLNILEFKLSFIPMPIYMQYKTKGRGEDYTAEFTILTKEQFAELLESAPKNELTPTNNE